MSDDAVRMGILIPQDLLNAVDREAGRGRRSEFIVDALRLKLQEIALERAAGALAGVDIPGWETPESTDAWVRAMRREGDGFDQRSDEE